MAMSREYDFEIMGLSPSLEKKLAFFVEGTGRKIQDKHDKIYHLRQLEAYGFDEKKAAARYNEAKKKANEAMEQVHEKMLAHIPKPVKDHFMTLFDTQEEADRYFFKVVKEGEKAFDKVWDEIYWETFDKYWGTQNETRHLIQ